MQEMITGKPLRRPDIQFRVIDNEIVLFDAAGGQAGYLNTTAAAIWQLCDGSRTEADIAAELATLVGVPAETLLSDISEVLAQFRAAGVLA